MNEVGNGCQVFRECNSRSNKGLAMSVYTVRDLLTSAAILGAAALVIYFGIGTLFPIGN